jgi:hypothetical protein
MSAEKIVRLIEKISLVLTGRGGAVPCIKAAGEVAGQKVETTVDFEAARYYLERRPLPGGDEKLYARVEELRRDRGSFTVSRGYLEELSKVFSPDVAALHLAEHLFGNELNLRFHSILQEHLGGLRALKATGGDAPRAAERYLALFVPGMHYKSFPETGADFARPRQILTQMGLENALLETDENGTVEANAKVIAEYIASHSRRSENIILVSASKSGPETGQALGELLGAQEAERVKAWINIGGLLQGTYLADWALRWPKRWFVQLLFACKGWNIQSVRSLATTRSRERFGRAKIPEHILVVNYVGIPLSGHITPRAKNNYRALRIHGPNDGLTLLSDEIVPHAITVVELGLDHYYLSPDIDMKAAALAYAVISQLESQGRTKTATIAGQTAFHPYAA